MSIVAKMAPRGGGEWWCTNIFLEGEEVVYGALSKIEGEVTSNKSLNF